MGAQEQYPGGSVAGHDALAEQVVAIRRRRQPEVQANRTHWPALAIDRHPQRLRFDIEVELASHVVGVNDEVDRILKGADYWIDSDEISRRLSRKTAASKTRKPVARKTKVTVSAKG